jgi:hypothetical protein
MTNPIKICALLQTRCFRQLSNTQHCCIPENQLMAQLERSACCTTSSSAAASVSCLSAFRRNLAWCLMWSSTNVCGRHMPHRHDDQQLRVVLYWRSRPSEQFVRHTLLCMQELHQSNQLQHTATKNASVWS